MSRVLLVTDDPVKERVSAWAIEQDGHEVSLATPDAALNTVGQIQPDVIVFNTVLPVEVQDEYVRVMKSMAPSAHVIDLIDPHGEPISSSDLILKEPYTPEELAEKVASLL